VFIVIEDRHGHTMLLPASELRLLKVMPSQKGGLAYMVFIGSSDDPAIYSLDRQAFLSVLAQLFFRSNDEPGEEAEEFLQKLERNPKGER